MKNYVLLALMSVYTLSSCTKEEPVSEVDQEQLSTAALVFTPVEKIENDGNTTYNPIAGEEIQSIKFEGLTYLPEGGAHLHLHVGDTYRLDLKTTDFYGRESQQTFLNRAENHQAFLLGADNSYLDFVYADDSNVGISAYITVKKASNTMKLNYIMRHVSSSAKKQLKASDWNNSSIKVGEIDLDLQFEAHLIDEDQHEH